ncbi:unnamed protein product [Arctogadus glacialis]
MSSQHTATSEERGVATPARLHSEVCAVDGGGGAAGVRDTALAQRHHPTRLGMQWHRGGIEGEDKEEPGKKEGSIYPMPTGSFIIRSTVTQSLTESLSQASGS